MPRQTLSKWKVKPEKTRKQRRRNENKFIWKLEQAKPPPPPPPGQQPCSSSQNTGRKLIKLFWHSHSSSCEWQVREERKEQFGANWKINFKMRQFYNQFFSTLVSFFENVIFPTIFHFTFSFLARLILKKAEETKLK